MKKLIFSSVLIVLLAMGCRKNEDITDVSVSMPEAEEIVFADITGIVKDDNEAGILEAKVQIIQGAEVIKEVFTNAKGIFTLESIPLKSDQVFMQVTKNGFLTATTRMEDSDPQSRNVEMVLMPTSMAPERGQPITPNDDLIVLTGKLVDESGEPVQRRLIMVQTPDEQIGYGFSIRTGEFRITTQPNVPLILMVIDRLCGETELNTEIGPFVEDFSLGELVLDPIEYLNNTISGSLIDCDGNAIINGQSQLILGNARLAAVSDENGSFSFAVPDCVLSETTEGFIIGYNVDLSNTSTPLTVDLSSGNITLDPITVCP